MVGLLCRSLPKKQKIKKSVPGTNEYYGVLGANNNNATLNIIISSVTHPQEELHGFARHGSCALLYGHLWCAYVGHHLQVPAAASSVCPRNIVSLLLVQARRTSSSKVIRVKTSQLHTS